MVIVEDLSGLGKQRVDLFPSPGSPIADPAQSHLLFGDQARLFDLFQGLADLCLAVAVDRRIAPPTAAPERSVPVSVHSAPQYSDAGYAYQPGGIPFVPGSSHHGNVHVRLGG